MGNAGAGASVIASLKGKEGEHGGPHHPIPPPRPTATPLPRTRGAHTILADHSPANGRLCLERRG